MTFSYNILETPFSYNDISKKIGALNKQKLLGGYEK
jgi:hypothetical protein